MPRLKKTPTEKMNDSFCLAITKGCIALDWTRSDLAEKMEVDPSTISQWKRDPGRMTMRYLRRLALLGVVDGDDLVSFIMGGDGKV